MLTVSRNYLAFELLAAQSIVQPVHLVLNCIKQTIPLLQPLCISQLWSIEVAKLASEHLELSSFILCVQILKVMAKLCKSNIQTDQGQSFLP